MTVTATAASLVTADRLFSTDPGTDTFTIDDDDDSIGALSLSAAPPSLTVGETPDGWYQRNGLTVSVA